MADLEDVRLARLRARAREATRRNCGHDLNLILDHVSALLGLLNDYIPQLDDIAVTRSERATHERAKNDSWT